jgi:hypothetical protein
MEYGGEQWLSTSAFCCLAAQMLPDNSIKACGKPIKTVCE